MMNFETFFINPVTKTVVSFANKKLFSESHIGKIIAQNTSHQYDVMLGLTITASTNFFGEITDILTKLGIQKAQTRLVDKVMADFTKRTSRLNAYFVSTELDKTTLYAVFFPEGVMGMTEKTNKGNIESHIGTLVNAITANTAEAGGSTVLTEYLNFQTDYATSRLLQTTNIGETKGAQTTRNDAEVNWENQIFDNILDLARLFKNQPSKVEDFFSQKYLRTDVNPLDAHVGTLAGLITRAGTGLPEADVQMHAADGGINDSYSKVDGKYGSQKLKTGFYKVTFSKAGFVSQTITVEINNDKITTQDVVMKLE